MSRMEAGERARLQWNLALEQRVAKAAGGDRSAFTEVYQVMYPAVAKYLYYKVGRRDEAEELAADTFLAAWRGLPRYRGSYFPGYVFGIARKLAAGAIRRRPRSRTVDLEKLKHVTSDEPQPDELVEQRRGHEQLYEALRKLKKEPREVVVLKYLVGMTNSQVGKLLGKSENAVNSQQNRALRRLGVILRKGRLEHG